MKKNHYDALGIPRNATPTQIRAAFRRLAKVDHPQRVPGGRDALLEPLIEAYETLINPLKREAYDLELKKREDETTSS